MSVKFLIRRANVDLHVLVADAAHEIGTKKIAAELPAGVTIHEADFAAGPGERRFFRGERFRRRIIFSVFRIFHWSRRVRSLPNIRVRDDHRKIGDGRGSHSS